MRVVLRHPRTTLAAITVAACTAATLAVAPVADASRSAHSNRAKVISPARGIFESKDGFVRSSSATATHLTTPSSAWSYNSSGGVNTVKRNAKGVYTVRMPGLGGSRGNVQVTAFGATTARCKLGSWDTANPALLIHVRCYRPSGALADSRFVAQYVRAGSDFNSEQSAYVSTTNGATPLNQVASIFPPLSYNSKSTSVAVTRTAVGQYQVDATGFDQIGGNVAVTAIGANSVHCVVVGWKEPTISVQCWDHTGSLANSRFSLRYSDHVMPNRHAGAYAWLSDIIDPAPVQPDTTYWFNTSGGPITALRNARGKYTVRLFGQPGAHSTSAMVTAYGDLSRYCGVTDWSRHSGTGFTAVHVACHRIGGRLADSAFTLSYLTNRNVL